MSIQSRYPACALVALLCATSLAPAAAAADDWWKDVKFSGYVQAGGETVVGSGHDKNPYIWGRTVDDRNDRFQLNQVVLTAERAIDSKKTYDLGFKLQGMFGTDARYDHFLGELDRAVSSREQFDIVEAYLNFHTPWLGKNGTDFKIGQYVTLEGAEVVSPGGNFFYSHSYIYSYGIPIKHTGILAVTHATDVLDLYYGLDTGVNTTFGRGTGDGNDQIAFHGGVGFNLLNGDLTILATTHIGDELPSCFPVSSFCAGNKVDTRYLNDVTIVWKTTKELTLTADLNYIRDDSKYFGASGNSAAEGGGIALQAAYQINDNLAFGLRGEWWRDSQGAFVGAFPGKFDFINAEVGRPNGSVFTGKGTDYFAITVGANIMPTVPKDFEGLKIRPEVRYDYSTDVAVFKNFHSKEQWTIGGDIVIPFALSH